MAVLLGKPLSLPFLHKELPDQYKFNSHWYEKKTTTTGSVDIARGEIKVLPNHLQGVGWYHFPLQLRNVYKSLTCSEMCVESRYAEGSVNLLPAQEGFRAGLGLV